MDVFQAELDTFTVREGEKFHPLHGPCLWVDEEGEAILFEGVEMLENDDFFHGAQLQRFGCYEALLVEGGRGLMEGGR